MTIPIQAIGMFSGPGRDLMIWLAQKATTWVQTEGPLHLRRMGDLIVWNSSQGQQVVAAVESLGESQHRIETAIAGIESAQLGLSSTLSVVQTLSVATLGVTCLSGLYMGYRLKAINTRLDRLSKQIADLHMRVDAQQRAVLENSVQYFQDFEHRGRRDDLDRSLEKARESAATWGRMVDNETEDQKRPAVLNAWGRWYALSLLVELQCIATSDPSEEGKQRVGKRINDEQERLRKFVATSYQETVAKAPEMFLHPSLRDCGVTLELLTDLYQQLEHAGALNQVEIRDAGDLFEHLRESIYAGSSSLLRRIFSPIGKAKQHCLEKLRYLIANVEDANRVLSLGLLVQQKDVSYSGLCERLRTEVAAASQKTADGGVLAYRFA